MKSVCPFCYILIMTVIFIPFPADVHKLELAEKFKTLKEKGQVKKFIKKKRTRNASKHSKTMPFN